MEDSEIELKFQKPLPRPDWVRKLRMFMVDDIFDDPSYPQDGSEDEIHDRIERAMNAEMCAIYGHEIVYDQCGIPEHRYCSWCSNGIATLEKELAKKLEDGRENQPESASK